MRMIGITGFIVIIIIFDFIFMILGYSIFLYFLSLFLRRFSCFEVRRRELYLDYIKWHNIYQENLLYLCDILPWTVEMEYACFWIRLVKFLAFSNDDEGDMIQICFVKHFMLYYSIYVVMVVTANLILNSHRKMGFNCYLKHLSVDLSHQFQLGIAILVFSDDLIKQCRSWKEKMKLKFILRFKNNKKE